MTTLKQIADYYEVDAHQFRDDIRAFLKQSRESAGQNGKSRWHYFDGYMLDTIAFYRADSVAAADFKQRAY